MWVLKRIPYDKDDPDRAERWIEWLDSPYWDERKRGGNAATVAAEIDAFAEAMD